MLFSAHQPQYLPWLGFFEKADRADVFVLLDDVQYKKNDWQNRNKIKTAKGAQWLTVPVEAHLGVKISETHISVDKPWVKDHLKSLETCYHRASYFNEVFPVLRETLQSQKWELLGALNLALIKSLLKLLGIPEKKWVLSSSLNIREESTARLVAIGKAMGADRYLSGEDGEKYLDLKQFEESRIAVAFQHYQHPAYAQLHGDFVTHLSVVDLLFNCGSQSLEILRKGRG